MSSAASSPPPDDPGALAAPTSTTGEQLAWAWQFPRRHLRPLVLVALLGLLGIGSGLLSPLVLMNLWNAVLQEPRDLSLLAPLVGILVVLALVGFGLNILTTWLYTRVSVRVLIAMRLALFRKLLLQPITFFTSRPVGDLHARLSGDIADLQSFIVDVPLAVLLNMATLLGSMLCMAYLSWQLFLVALVPIPFAILIVRAVRERITRASRAVRDRNGEISSVLVESLTGASFLKSFAMENRQARRFLGKNRLLLREVVHMQMLAALAGGSPELILRLGSLGVLAVGAVLVDSGALAQGAGGLIALGMYQMGLFSPTSSLLGMIVRFQQAKASMARVFEVLDRASEVPESATARALPTCAGNLSFSDVDYAYPDSQQPVLAGINLQIPAGGSIAIIGASGAGKSTLLGLLLRTMDPARGIVRVDGQDLRELRRAAYLRHVGVVTQETFLLHDTLEENLRCVHPRARAEELQRALEIADLGTLIARLPEGLATVVGERGARLSGGERQRVAIARAVLKDPRILVLDEAASALDWDTDRRIREALARLMAGRTTIIVTHRVFTVGDLDQVVVLEAGRIVQQGRPRDLRECPGPYRELLERAGEPRATDAPANRGVARVAIVDSGIVAGHPHIGAVAGGVCLTGLPNDSPATDRVGHGTPVAAVVRWGAPLAELYSVKVFDRDLVTTAARIAAGLRWAIQQKMDVVCLSLGARESDQGLADLRLACQEAQAANVIVVAAARGDAPSYPACWPEVIGVLQDDRLKDFEITYRPDAPIPFAASGRPRPIPGVPQNLNVSGPSFAAPRIAALAANIRAEFPHLPAEDVRRELRRRS